MNKWKSSFVVACGCIVMAGASKIAGDNGHLVAGTLAVAVPVTLIMCRINRDWWPFVR